jgi:hypothetical protein
MDHQSVFPTFYGEAGFSDLVSVRHFRCSATALQELRSVTKEDSSYPSIRAGITVLRKHPLVSYGRSVETTRSLLPSFSVAGLALTARSFSLIG